MSTLVFKNLLHAVCAVRVGAGWKVQVVTAKKNGSGATAYEHNVTYPSALEASKLADRVVAAKKLNMLYWTVIPMTAELSDALKAALDEPPPPYDEP